MSTKVLILLFSIALADYQSVVSGHFNDYKNRNYGLLSIIQEHTRWTLIGDSIVNMTLVQQANYADYVTMKVMAEPKEIHFGWLKNDVLPQLRIFSKERANAASYGNMAYVLLHLAPTEPLWGDIAHYYNAFLNK